MQLATRIVGLCALIFASAAIAKQAEVPIPRSMPGDKGKYSLISKKKTGNVIQVVHKRVGVSTIDYTLTEVNCKTGLMRVLGESDESPNSIRKKPTKWFELVPGSSKSDLARFVCK